MAPLGPFEPAPRLGLAVSGGADSLAMALLAKAWATERAGSVLAIVVDHGLRPASAGEAVLTRERLAMRGIPVHAIRLDIPPGAALAARARAARYAALIAACAERGIPHLLLGHHAADQAETLLIRAISVSGEAGLAGIAALRETDQVRLLRPLLTIPPARLRATLRADGLEWIEDPSNADQRALRARLRRLRADRDGVGPATAALAAAATAAGVARRIGDEDVAAFLGASATLRPEGFAVLRPGPVPLPALGALIQAISGGQFPPRTASLAALARDPRPATLSGVRLLPAGRLGPGLLLVREATAIAPPIPAETVRWNGTRWDGRFRLACGAVPPADLSLGALGEATASLRRVSRLPSAVLRTLPALRREETLFAVPHLGYPDAQRCASVPLVFDPARPAACAPFMAA
ncbi:MAG: tRNA lysidine(34) synthetase TilS [Alphaproteobacteria bacterium]|nr:tRNA lysidine(34) synthetase TilS [Alphaproteobacteria bacterium]